jgi:hypothetical protein
VRQIVRDAVQFTGNPECEKDDAARVAALEDEGQDGEAIVGAAGALVHSDDSRLTVADPDEQAVGDVGPFHEMPEGGELAAVRGSKTIRGGPGGGAKGGRVGRQGAVIIAEAVSAGGVGDNDPGAGRICPERVHRQ